MSKIPSISYLSMQPRTVCVPALKAVRDWGENRRCYGNLKKRKCAGYAV